MKTRLLLLLSIFTLTFAHAQPKRLLDSLEASIDTAGTIERRVKAMNELASRLIDYDNAKAHLLVNKAFTISDSINYDKGRISALNTMASLSNDEGNYSDALEKLKTALSIAESTNDSLSAAKCYYTIGDVFKTLKSYDRAIIYFKQALEYYIKLKDKQYCAVSINKIAHSYLDKGILNDDSTSFVKAMFYYNKALEIAFEVKDTHKITVGYINLSNAYNKLGTKTKNKDLLFKSLDFSMRGLRLSKSNKDKVREGMCLTNIGEVYEILEQYNKALSYFKLALKLFEDSKVNFWITYENAAIGSIYHKMGDEKNALKHTSVALERAQAANLKSLIAKNNEQISVIYASMKNFDKAYHYHRLSDIFKDSMSNENATLSVLRLQTELESEKKDKEIELLKKNKEIQNQIISKDRIFNNSLIIAILLLVVLLVLLYNRNLIRKKSTIEILKAKESAEQAKETQEQFLANTSHEIRTPMNGIIGMTNHLKDTALTSEQNEYISAINESANSLLVLINDLLDLSKINAGKMTFEKKAFRLSDLFKNLIYSLQYRSTEKNIRLISSIDEAIPSGIIGDPIRLNQVLLNLTGNAIKFTEKGEVKIIAKLLKDDGKNVLILFSVQDTGIGIQESKLSTIFESFTQVNAKTTRKYGGTGLGLTIAKQLIEQQGGNISVSSKVNEGSTFSFTLQFKKLARNVKEQRSMNIQAVDFNQPNLNSINVLVIDDNKVNQRVAALTLKKWNAKVDVADNARIAFNKLIEKKYDLILMDVTMPEMDGFDATIFIRKKMPSPINKIPIIAMTASALIGDRERCISVGMNEYVSKPFNPEELYDKIVKIIPVNMISNPPIVDLSILHERAEGDNEYLKDIIESYIQEMPRYVKEMKIFISERNIKAICAQAHKMKSPAKLLGAFALNLQMEFIEKNIEKEGLTEEMVLKVEEMNTLCLETVEALKKEILNLSKV
jgi:signal transduction histidine kinase/ActR/RegA family two-component response regulator